MRLGGLLELKIPRATFGQQQYLETFSTKQQKQQETRISSNITFYAGMTLCVAIFSS